MKKLKIFIGILIILISLNLTAQPGQLDQSFGDEGKVIFNYGMDYNYFAYDATIQYDGKTVIVGSVELANNKNDVFVMRLNEDGSLDNSFAGRGFENYKISDSDIEYGRKVKVIGSKIIVAGFSGTKAFLLKLNQNGEVDESFGSGGSGIVLTSFLNTINDFITIPLINTYDIVCAGLLTDGVETKPALLRYTENGTQIKSFGVGGLATPLNTINGYFTNLIAGISTIYASGTKHNFEEIDDDALICRFDFSGNPTGFVTVKDPLGGNKRNNLKSLIINESNELFLCGDFTSDEGVSAYMCKLESGGNIDRTFGDSGYRYTNQTETMSSIQIQKNGKIVLGGTSNLLGTKDFNLIRLNSDGSDDLTFNEKGWLLTDFLNGEDQLERINIQSDGKIIAIGNSDNILNNIVVARYLVDASSNAKDNIKSTLNLKVYPSILTENKINISFQSQTNEPFSIDLISSKGGNSINLAKGNNLTKENNKQYILPSNFPTGIYYLKVESKTLKSVEKIIKM